MQASVEVAGTRIATTRCTLIVNQRFCARVWMANVPLDLFTYRFSGDWKITRKRRTKTGSGGVLAFFRGMWWQTTLCLRWVLHHPTACLLRS